MENGVMIRGMGGKRKQSISRSRWLDTLNLDTIGHYNHHEVVTEKLPGHNFTARTRTHAHTHTVLLYCCTFKPCEIHSIQKCNIVK